MKFLSIPIALLAATASMSSAWAASGTVTGRILFYQEQGNYCASSAGQNCTHAYYPESQFHTNQPIREAQVQVVNASNTAEVIGQGASDGSGNFSIAWTDSTPPANAKILVKFRQKDTRFEIVSYSSGGIYYATSSSFALTSGTQARGNINFGSNSVANLYDGAFRAWTDAFRYSGILSSRFTGVKIRAFDPDCPGTREDGCECPTSCASGKGIIIATEADAYKPLHRMMHELGHVVNDLAKPTRTTSAYCYPDETGRCGWSMTSEEWDSAGFEEGLATLHAVKALYGFDAVEPTQCLSSSYCSTTSTSADVELSLGPSASCTTAQRRWPLNHLRYLWDVYDKVNDGTYTDSVHITYGDFVAALDAYPTGFANHQNEEPYASNGTIDALDGRSSSDYEYNLQQYNGTDTGTQWTNNCGM